MAFAVKADEFQEIAREHGVAAAQLVYLVYLDLLLVKRWHELHLHCSRPNASASASASTTRAVPFVRGKPTVDDSQEQVVVAVASHSPQSFASYASNSIVQLSWFDS